MYLGIPLLYFWTLRVVCGDTNRRSKALTLGEVLSRTRSALPAVMTSYVGRGELAEEARRLLKTARLVTLAGPGGVGKTRTAWELARELEADYDTVAVADLVDIGLAEALEHWLVSTLGVAAPPGRPAFEALTEYLGGKRVLLVLDNCEHLCDALGDVVRVLLEDAPELVVLATSRRPLEIAGEHVLQVPPLPLPPAGVGRGEAALSDAVTLLLDRACAAGRPIADSGDWDAVVDLVRWSGGLPLVLELIAVRLGGGLSPATIMQRLDGGRLLRAQGRQVPTHHLALWDVLAWSHDMCVAGEQRLWARLSVFAGGFDLAMAEEVCGDPDGPVATPLVVDLLTGLVRQSVVIADPDGRFRQLQPMREYGLSRLQALGEEERTRERHCALVHRLVSDSAERTCSPTELATFRQISREMPNIRTALAFCDTPERAETGLRIATDITQLGFSFFAAFLDEISTWLERLLTHAAPVPAPARVNALAMLALMRLWRGDQDLAGAYRQECLAQARGLRAADADLPIVSFLDGVYLMLAHSDPRSVVPLAQARDAFAARNAPASAFRARIWSAVAAGFVAPRDIAEQAAAESLADARAHGGPWSMSWALWAQGRAAHAQPQRAITLLRQALRMMIEIGDQLWGATLCVEAIAWELAGQGHAVLAARLLGAVADTQESTGVITTGPGPFQRERERALTHIRAVIGDEACTANLDRGNGLDAEEIYALALSDVTAAATRRTSELPLDALTRRQQQIARLIALGHSNKQIAEKLHISQRTAENHLSQIFARLNVRNRAQVAAWVTDQTSTA